MNLTERASCLRLSAALLPQAHRSALPPMTPGCWVAARMSGCGSIVEHLDLQGRQTQVDMRASFLSSRPPPPRPPVGLASNLSLSEAVCWSAVPLPATRRCSHPNLLRHGCQYVSPLDVSISVGTLAGPPFLGRPSISLSKEQLLRPFCVVALL